MSADLVAGDTESKVQLTLRDRTTKLPLPLAGKTVTLRFKIGNNPAMTRLMTIVDAVNAQVEYQFAAGELVEGVMGYEAMTTDGLGKTLTSIDIGVREVRARLG